MVPYVGQAAPHFDGEQRICYHSPCPHFDANFCNAYPVVPTYYQDCGFPKRMERLCQQWSKEKWRPFGLMQRTELAT